MPGVATGPVGACSEVGGPCIFWNPSEIATNYRIYYREVDDLDYDPLEEVTLDESDTFLEASDSPFGLTSALKHCDKHYYFTVVGVNECGVAPLYGPVGSYEISSGECTF